MASEKAKALSLRKQIRGDYKTLGSVELVAEEWGLTPYVIRGILGMASRTARYRPKKETGPLSPGEITELLEQNQDFQETVALFDLLGEMPEEKLSEKELREILTILGLRGQKESEIEEFLGWIEGKPLDPDKARSLSKKLWRVCQWLLLKVSDERSLKE